jgi:hypothetical protein
VPGSFEHDLREASDPLAASVAWMGSMTPSGTPWPPSLPDEARLPSPLRFELARVLHSIGRAHRSLQRSLALLPASVTAELLIRQAVRGQPPESGEPDYLRHVSSVGRESLMAGMLDLVASVQRLQAFVKSAPGLPRLSWTLDTPLGQVVVDTTGLDNVHRLRDPLLVLDVGGNDRYEFETRRAGRRISVLLDHGGDDRYVALAPAADPSAAVLGYGILWDTEGDDIHEGSQLAQGAALFGASLLVDGGGRNRFIAGGQAQGYAVGGIALLVSGPGDDRFTAQTDAQGSAGPEGVAVLLDIGGNDRYTLGNSPLARPSPQLPDRNTSMGQGAGRGIRDADGVGKSTGGIGILLDLSGDDHYVAQVFAQGAAYHEGAGLLIDDGGNDRFDAAWYAMGAAAHQGAGVMLKRGSGNDRYRASHSTSMGAAHDLSVGFFLDEGGNDRYRLGNLGLGAASDNGIAFFVDAAGNDTYEVAAGACHAFGATRIGQWGSARDMLPNVGLFMDLGGSDKYAPECPGARNDAGWVARKEWPDRVLRSEAGAGIDGEFPSPFAVRRRDIPRQQPGSR